ncbi:unnamed protein product [Paramecium primaurelia]|uniref:Uncharacterized protein n=1 Tax=Paramecium primaurelia TaxID=5886 RepID=A0A8S1P070_PARPR|nr:unnamed protein product [Paramecium primaurelia]
MNSKKNNHALQKSIIWKQSNKWDQEKYKRVKESIQIRIKKNNEIVYSTSDGEILRIEKPQEYLINHFLFNNKDQIKNLLWFCEYRQSNRQYQKWSATWGGEVLRGVGGYINNGLKEGSWKELIQNYSSQVIVYQIGQYLNDKKKGIWEFMYKNNKIGSGLYNEQGQKHCKWRELSHDFSDQSQITLKGEYKNGKKIGRWDVFYGEFELIGGGSYDEIGNSTKIGHWIELRDDFWNQSQVIFIGEYKNSQKLGRWNILYRQINKQNFKQIGGGCFSESKGLKEGQWTELSDGFWYDQQITIKGVYKKGKKVGKWNIWYHNRDTNKNDQMQKIKFTVLVEEVLMMKEVMVLKSENGLSQVMGFGLEHKQLFKVNIKMDKDMVIGIFYIKINRCGGLYSQGGNEIKVGKWIELYEEFYDDLQITYNGIYKFGKKVGRWNILFRKIDKFQLIGGGSYQIGGNENKVGKWIELSNEFKIHSQITYIGEYKNSKKIGYWDIYWYWLGNIKMYCIKIMQLQVVVGHMMKMVMERKLGNGLSKAIILEIIHKSLLVVITKMVQKLVDGIFYLRGRLWNQCKILMQCKLLVEVGNILLKEMVQRMEGGLKQISIFLWIYNLHILENIKMAKKLVNGIFVIGIVEQINLKKCQYKNLENFSGGGLYLQGGDGQKVGIWIELSDQFKQYEQISYAGEYNKNGKKVGRWDIWYKDSETKYNEQIGGGYYDQEGQGVKIGSWIELCEGFKKSQLFSKEITYNGEYIKDRKVGRWDIMYREWNKESFHQIGYGYYDERGDGIKIGKWMELSYWFYVDRQITYIGEYKNGKKIGIWLEFDIKKNEIIKEMKYDD